MQAILRDFFAAYSPHLRATISLSIPVMIGQLGQILMGFIDNLMIGNLGYVPLSAAALANGIFIIFFVFGMGVTFAISPLVAEADSAGNPEQVGKLLRQGTWVGLAISLIMGLIILFAGELLPYLNQPAEDVELAQPYLRIIGISIIPGILFLVFKQFSDGLSLTRIAMYVTLVGLVINVFCNWLLIYGNLGFPRLELDGAGYATLISRMFMFILMAGYVFFSKNFLHYNLMMGWFKLRPKVIRKILEIGIPSGFQFFSELAAFVGAVVMIGWMENGSANRAAHQIAIQIAAVTYMIVSGIAAGATIRVGNALGRKDSLAVKQAGMAGIYLSVVFMSLSAVAFLLFRDWLPTLFVEDPFVLNLAANLLILAAAFQLFDGIQVVALGILRGIQDVRIPTLITVAAYWGIGLGLGYVFAFPLGSGIVGIWYGLILSLAFASVFLTWRFRILTRKMMHEKKPIILQKAL